MLIIIIALIYLLSLMPTTPPHIVSNGMLPPPDAHTADYAMKGQGHIDLEKMRFRPPTQDEIFDEPSHCLNGVPLTTNGTCVCSKYYTGPRCDIPICMNGGVYNATSGKCDCSGSWTGEFCLVQCAMGYVNRTTGLCECLPGLQCHKCVHGQFYDGKCVCYDGFTGLMCTTCDGLGCDDSIRKRGAVNSRLTLSGLSFCIITIGLLCVGARRKRAMSMPYTGETWYRMFHPENQRPFRCRHDYVCGGSWVPRDRALIVAPGRVTVHPSGARIHRLATPPPSYTSVDNLTPEQQPPTYEEATRIDIENGEILETPEAPTPTDDDIHMVVDEMEKDDEERV
ncbi:unnamed protein product [Caenorhabditis bovis]|uniref:EGF-like domain-containing protein n=1 Tax=Caenorhabditis bovis TaxID=2654633 RepID=A0A8S1ET22_9PELO|nr:unnamed protein product [Caenorhabditis bovis]